MKTTDRSVHRLWVALAAILLCSALFAQDGPREQTEKQDKPPEKEPHLLGVIPMGDIAQQPNERPLSSTGKLRLFFRDSRDPFILLPPLMATGFSEALLGNAGFGWGPEGFGAHFGASLANDTSNRLLGTWVLPSLLHQDPRYYPKGKGGAAERLPYALSRAFVTRSDAGEKQVNYSRILAALISSSISNSYYPEGHTGVKHTFSTAGINLGITAGFNVAREFFPELYRVTTRHKTAQPGTGSSTPVH